MKITLNTSALLNSQKLKEQMEIIGTNTSSPGFKSSKLRPFNDESETKFISTLESANQVDESKLLKKPNQKDAEAQKLYFNI